LTSGAARRDGAAPPAAVPPEIAHFGKVAEIRKGWPAAARRDRTGAVACAPFSDGLEHPCGLTGSVGILSDHCSSTNALLLEL
jgi:hypothetical protein